MYRFVSLVPKPAGCGRHLLASVVILRAKGGITYQTLNCDIVEKDAE
jgi:hypothetical protein